MILQSLLALGVGLVLGATFAWFRLPIPAPMSLGGILGIVGIALGATLIGAIANR